jgi:gallate decarboxylase subunit D
LIPHIQTISLSSGEPPYQVEALITKTGNDLVISVGGGSCYHVGAVAVAHAHASLRDAQSVNSTVSVITLPGHKEDEIVQAAARKLSKQLNCSVVLSAGMHIDSASEYEIQLLVENFQQLTNQIINTITKIRGDQSAQNVNLRNI